jgi:hypothetical protein
MDANVRNRTDYFENSLGWEYGKPTLGAFIGFTTLVFWHATAPA